MLSPVSILNLKTVCTACVFHDPTIWYIKHFLDLAKLFTLYTPVQYVSVFKKKLFQLYMVRFQLCEVVYDASAGAT